MPIVCLPIWHWYMLRGDWLKSQKGVSEATIEKRLDGVNSECVDSPGVVLVCA